jgi:colanic acid biosynthesis glycosyl transferase WcaI
MRILIVTQYFWPEEFLVNDFVQGLKERGHYIEVLTGLPNYPSGALFKGYSLWGPWHDEHHGVHIRRCPLIPRGNGSGVRLALNYISFTLFSCLWAIFSLWGRYDVILVYQLSPVTVGMPGIMFKAKSRSKLVLWVQDLWPESLSAAGGTQSAAFMRVISALTRSIYRRCDRILIQSRGFMKSLIHLGIDAHRIQYLPNFAEELFDRQTRNGPGSGFPKTNKFKVMFAGNIGIAQDFGTIIEAAELTRGHDNLEWLVVGDGRQKAWLSKEIADRKLENIRLLGRHPKVEMPSVLAEADVLLVSLKRDPLFALTIPSKIQAYLASGKPLLASLDGEAAHIIEEAGAGLSVPAEHPDMLASAAIRLSQFEQEQLDTMGQNARSYYQANFSRGHIIDEFEKHISNLLTGS